MGAYPRERVVSMGAKVKLFLVILLLCTGAFVVWRWQKDKAARAFYRNFPRGIIRVEVLNGTDIADLAYTLTKILRLDGFDVAEFGNAPSMKYPETVIIDRTGRNPEKISILKTYFEVDKAVILYDDRREMEKIDATVILGRDILTKELFQNHKNLLEVYL